MRLLILAAAVACDALPPLDEHVAAIQSHLRAAAAARPPRSTWRTCVVSAAEPCALADLPVDESVLVYPGGATGCLDGSPYAFQVVRGDERKLWFNFEEGGACWDALSSAARLCTQSVDGGYALGAGLFDRARADNPLRAHTLVTALYCSGDAFVSNNKTQPWRAANGAVARQAGQQNVMATIDWARAQPALAAPLASLYVAGQSAGALGAQAWSAALLALFPAAAQTVMPDSYLGIFPEGSQQLVLNATWPVCDGGPLEAFMAPRTLGLCRAGNLTLQAWMVDAMAARPDVPYGWVQSKYDETQISFYVAIAATLRIAPDALGPAACYRDANDIFVRYDAAPNALHFFVQGGQHTYGERDLVYTTTPAGAHGASGPALVEWIANMTANGAQRGTTECYGDLKSEGDWSGTDYCASELAGKVFPPHLN